LATIINLNLSRIIFNGMMIRESQERQFCRRSYLKAWRVYVLIFFERVKPAAIYEDAMLRILPSSIYGMYRKLCTFT